MNTSNKKVAVVIPAYKVTSQILSVLEKIDSDVSLIFVIDDACPEGSGKYVQEKFSDTRLRVIFHEKNQGVGGAVLTGYQAALAENIDIIVKVDGDGQMDPALIPQLIAPIVAGEADYTKGNRFFDLESVSAMPGMRLFGNAILSLMAKLSTGYWDLFDPTNGFTAISRLVARELPIAKISRRYFFETDLLFRLNTLRAVVVDVPMVAKYADEVSNLKIADIIGEFLWRHCANFAKRVFYNYYLRDMSLASIELPLGLLLIFIGSCFGFYHWIASSLVGAVTPAGTVMLAALPILMGTQLLLAFLSYDITSVPKRPRNRY